MRIYDLELKKFITIKYDNIKEKSKIDTLSLVLDNMNLPQKGDIYSISNFVNMMPNEGYSSGISKVPSNNYTEDENVIGYFSDINLIYYDLNNIRIYFKFNIEILKDIDHSPYFFDMIGDNCDLIIYKK